MSEISEIRRLSDILSVHVGELTERLGDNLQGLICYGSYFYQDLNIQVNTFKKLKGGKGLLDKKPDFVAVVSDLETAINEINKLWVLKKRRNRFLSRLRPDTPSYFNKKTRDKHAILWKGKSKNVKLPFKIGLIGEKEFNDLHNIKNHNIYLFCRISKPVNVIGINNQNGTLDQQIERSRDYLVDLALTTLPRRFTGKDLVQRYSAITYWCEAFRFFDIMKRKRNRKYISLLDKRFYDTDASEIVGMKSKFEQILVPRIQEKKDVREISHDNDFYERRFVKRDNGLNPEEVVSRFAPINVFSAYASMYKSWITTGPAKGVLYVLRKILRIFPGVSKYI